jgi:HD-like signal output (HDOD) protein
VSQAMPESREIRQINLANIPALPAIVLRVLDIVSQDHPDFPLLVHEITSDATLSAQVLRLANSARFGFAAQIGTVQHAVLALGSSEIQSLVMSVAVANYSRASLKTEAMQRCWRHTLASAVVCREIARAAGMPAEQAYSLGLLHDIGRLGLLVAWPDDYNRILKQADRDNLSLLDLEKRLFTMDHCEVGCRLVEQWKLPPDFCVVAGRHHDPPAGGTRELDHLRVAYFGCQIADSLGYWVAKPLHEKPLEQLLAELPADVLESFPADPAELRGLVEQSVAGGGELLYQSPPEYIQIPRVQSDALIDEPGKADAIESRSAAPEIGERPIGWDLAIVLATVLTFVAVMVVLRFLGSPGSR